MHRTFTFSHGLSLLLIWWLLCPAVSAQDSRRRRDLSPWELAYEDFMARYPEARLYGAPQGGQGVVILFRQDDQPAYATYDEKGRWQGTASRLTHSQLPVGPLKLMHQTGAQFSCYIKIDQPGFRPRYVLMDKLSTWIMHPSLLTEQGLPGDHVFAGVAMQEGGAHVPRLAVGASMMEVPPAQRAWSGVALTADGGPCTLRELTDLATAGLLRFLAPVDWPAWLPPLDWKGRADCPPLPTWRPDPAWYTGEEPGAVHFTSEEAM